MSTTEQKALAEPGMNSAAAFEEVRRLSAENEAMRASLNKANAQTEEFERKWYLVTDERDALRAQVEALTSGREAIAEAAVVAANARKGLEGLSEFLPDASSPLNDEVLRLRAQVEALTAERSTWFALVMNAAADLEDAHNCLRDQDAKRSAASGAKHYRKSAKAMWSDIPTPSPLTRPASFPERDTTRPAEQQGLFRKFSVSRVDGSDAPGGKHHGCEYFVLDMDHDKAAPAALVAYADAVAETHPQLAADLRARFGKALTGPAVPEGWDQIEQIATTRYKVTKSDSSMFHRHAVVAGDGERQLYLGREVECEIMARKFSGAFLDGAYLCQQMIAAAPQPPYKDSTPHLSVGDSSFESWYSTYDAKHKGDKQRARDAYAAGMGDPLVQAAPQPEAQPTEAAQPITRDQADALWNLCLQKYKRPDAFELITEFLAAQKGGV